MLELQGKLKFLLWTWLEVTKWTIRCPTCWHVLCWAQSEASVSLGSSQLMAKFNGSSSLSGKEMCSGDCGVAVGWMSTSGVHIVFWILVVNLCAMQKRTSVSDEWRRIPLKHSRAFFNRRLVWGVLKGWGVCWCWLQRSNHNSRCRLVCRHVCYFQWVLPWDAPWSLLIPTAFQEEVQEEHERQERPWVALAWWHGDREKGEGRDGPDNMEQWQAINHITYLSRIFIQAAFSAWQTKIHPKAHLIQRDSLYRLSKWMVFSWGTFSTACNRSPPGCWICQRAKISGKWDGQTWLDGSRQACQCMQESLITETHISYITHVHIYIYTIISNSLYPTFSKFCRNAAFLS